MAADLNRWKFPERFPVAEQIYKGLSKGRIAGVKGLPHYSEIVSDQLYGKLTEAKALSGMVHGELTEHFMQTTSSNAFPPTFVTMVQSIS